MGSNENSKRLFLNYLKNFFLFSFLSQFTIIKNIKAKKIKPKVVVVGSGFGGGTCIKFLSKFSKILDLYVIDKYKKIQTCPFSNLVIGDVIGVKEITFNLNKKHAAKFYSKKINYIDSEKKRIFFSDDLFIDYDILILSPGIGFKNNQIDGYSIDDEQLVPHCWTGDKQIIRFREMLNSLNDSCNIIISSPDYPYRCPPAPYERASMIAHYLKEKKKKFKIFILDSKNSFTKKEIFFNEWKKKYGNSIEWISKNDGGKIININSKEVTTENGLKFSPDFLHVIPNQRAADIFFDSGLISDDWCPINPVNFEIIGHKDIYALGDSIDAGDMPKSGFSANSQAKMLSMNLINKILDKDYIDPVFLNTCYSFSSKNRAFSITSWYKLNNQKNRIVSLGSKESEIEASDFDRLQESKEAFDWYKNITNLIYG